MSGRRSPAAGVALLCSVLAGCGSSEQQLDADADAAGADIAHDDTDVQGGDAAGSETTGVDATFDADGSDPSDADDASHIDADIPDAPLEDTPDAPLEDTPDAPLEDTPDAPLEDTPDAPGDDVLPECVDGATEPRPVACPLGGAAVVTCTCVDGEWACPEPDCRDRSCDEGLLECDAVAPDCVSPLIAAIQTGCWLCVDPETCMEPSVDACLVACGVGCPAPEFQPCGVDGNRYCNTCIMDCYGVAVSDDPGLCTRSAACDDGSEPVCDRIPPVCGPGEIMAVQEGCEICVNPETCAPWGVPECATTADCTGFAEYCDPCGSSSCPSCDDCVPACVSGT